MEFFGRSRFALKIMKFGTLLMYLNPKKEAAAAENVEAVFLVEKELFLPIKCNLRFTFFCKYF